MEISHEYTWETTPKCTICGNSHSQHQFMFQSEYPVWQCTTCHSQFLFPQPEDATLASIYQDNYFLGGDDDISQKQRQSLKRATARLFLDQLLAYRGSHGGTLLEIGCGQGELLIEAERIGYSVTGIEYSQHAVDIANSSLKTGQVFKGEISTVNLPSHSFDVLVTVDVVEHVRNPQRFVEEMHRLLKPGGVLLMTTISRNSWSYKLLGNHWMEFKTEHLHYFSDTALFALMFRNGYRGVRIAPAYKMLTLEYIRDHFDRYPVPVLTPVIKLLTAMIPLKLKQQYLKLTGSGVTVFARAEELVKRPKLSVVIPAFNEMRTFSTLIDQVLKVELDGIDKEIIVVESNSTDGTREQVLSYQDHPLVRVILQDKPSGKGFAVREGLYQATGDIVLIQDADLEYSVQDYQKLIDPLLMGYTPFVLGSRHVKGNSWNIRHFSSNQKAASVMNFGHVLFRSMLNLLYGQKMVDPFTMYKVFWRDAIVDMKFESNRFDFDFELVIKLIRRGLVPLEIPISYTSRSFDDGKKINFVRDPLTWLVALVKFRFSPMYVSDENEQQ